MKTTRNHILSGLTLIIFILLSIASATNKKTQSVYSKTLYASFKVVTEPPGAHVSFTRTNKYMGLTPTSSWSAYNNTGYPVTNEFLIEKPGYIPVKKSLTVYPKYENQAEAEKDVTTLFVILKQETSSTFQTAISISSEPSGAAVYGNENFWGNTPLEQYITWSNANSRIELRIEKSGYITNRRVVTPTDKRIHVVLQSQ